jgi:hypothetical protein
LILHERSLLMYSPSIYLVELWNTIKINWDFPNPEQGC